MQHRDDWVEYVDPATGAPYFHSPNRRQTTWTRPPPTAQQVANHAGGATNSGAKSGHSLRSESVHVMTADELANVESEILAFRPTTAAAAAEQLAAVREGTPIR